MTMKEVIELMKSSATTKEWNANCDKVKEAHDGGYPPYWFKEIILSGLMRSLGFDDRIHVIY